MSVAEAIFLRFSEGRSRGRFLMSCAHCSPDSFAPSKWSYPLCSSCLDQARLEPDHGLWQGLCAETSYPLSALWPYQGPIRQAILAFKMQGRWPAGARLVEWASEEPALRRLLQGIDAVMPIPSSLWGRWRGRLDLAALLAQVLADSAGKPLVDPPRRYWGSWRKQAQRSRRERSGSRSAVTLSWSDQYFLPYGLSEKTTGRSLRILLVDDIVTSGQTLTEYADRFRNISFQFFALASAHHAMPLQSPLECGRSHEHAKS